MQWPVRALSAAALFCIVDLVAGQAPRNVSFDDQDTRITYSPSRSVWTVTEPGEWDAGDGRAHMLSDNPQAKASFKFTGIALYYHAARWPYAVFTTLTIDGKDTVLNLTDPDPAPGTPGLPPSHKSSVVFSATDLPNSEHDVTVSIGRGPEGNFAIVDFFTFIETGQGSSATTASSMGSPSSVTESDAASTPTDASQIVSPSQGLSTPSKVGIAVGIIALLALLLGAVFLLRWLKKRKEAKRPVERPMLTGYQYPDPFRSIHSSLMLNKEPPSPTPTSPMWSDPNYAQGEKRVNTPDTPYQQAVGSRSSVRLVVPEDDPRRFTDGSDYSSKPAQITPFEFSDEPIHIPYHPYATSQPYSSN